MKFYICENISNEIFNQNFKRSQLNITIKNRELPNRIIQND